MQITLKTSTDITKQKTECLVVPVPQKGETAAVKHLKKTCGSLWRALERRGDSTGKTGQTLLVPVVPELTAERLLLVGVGDKNPLAEKDFRKMVDATLKVLTDSPAKEAYCCFEDIAVEGRDTEWQLTMIAKLAGLSGYRYRATLSKPKEAPALRKLVLAGNANAGTRAAVAHGTAIARGMNTARELGNLPGNHCTPTYLASQARALGRKHQSLKVSVLDEKKMRELGMGAFLSVSAGSDQPAKMIVMEYRGARKEQKPQVLVGKGITFDSGGISIKPGAKMDEMKFDMCGAASVMGTMTALTELKLPVNVVGIIAASENLPNGRATKPGDVVKSMSGQTIEVLNTDAEGRMVLCDALTYAGRYKPAAVVDIATLTGACVVALGSHASALYSNQDDFAEELLECGNQVDDRAWHMPLWDDYQKQLDSNFADMANIGGPEAGSITAACFLSRYTADYRWAHLDIAGTAWTSGGSNKGASGRPVALLTQYLIRCAQGK